MAGQKRVFALRDAVVAHRNLGNSPPVVCGWGVNP
jgi:hypothetical protein